VLELVGVLVWLEGEAIQGQHATDSIQLPPRDAFISTRRGRRRNPIKSKTIALDHRFGVKADIRQRR
jgi:hypothetical protein